MGASHFFVGVSCVCMLRVLAELRDALLGTRGEECSVCVLQLLLEQLLACELLL